MSLTNLKKGQFPCHFALPLIHLFWGASEQNQRTYYHHLLVLQNEFSLQAQGDLPGLTTEEWRSILGNTYWKSMWPRPNPSDVTLFNFNLVRFWVHGGPLFFGEMLSAEVASRRDVSSILPCCCKVEMDMANNVEIHQTILYHLNMDHALAKIKEMDCLQFPLDFKRQWDQGRLNAILSMTDMWGPCREGGVKLGFFEDKKAWRLWLRAACEVIMDWEAFDK